MSGATAAGESGHQRRRELSVDEHVDGVLAGDRVALARTITLIESDAVAHQEKAQAVLRRLLPHAGRSIRVGVTGAPGAGKSSLIEVLGMRLVEAGHRLAVLAIDPSSRLTHGSILGDKTRMELLSRDPRCFIRPSPTGGTLGGVARKSRETVVACEAAGFDVVLIETVGVGQSEVEVRSMVDFFLLLLIPGAGDELQGIKRGVMELADLLVVNKADGELRQRALAARAEHERAVHYLQPATRGWRTAALACSALGGEGIGEIWDVVERFRRETERSGVFEERRLEQARAWMRSLIDDELRTRFYGHPGIAHLLPELERQVVDGTLAATAAVSLLLASWNASAADRER
ncbi:MAG TPA: methylmalonyl Co-A mutase-associated GTPase MeaB [Polyangia bacterium]|nr:methylmalonyl Co-A mutase-associated GTPase MeaB [Polyangia bacterium]